jgi:hypothetical protein
MIHPIISTVILAVIILIAFVLLLRIKKVSTWMRKNEKKIVAVKVFASIITIISIIFAVATYFEQRKIVDQNNEVILENLRKEINDSLKFISDFEIQEPNLKTGTLLIDRLKYDFLERSTNIIENRGLRELIMVSIYIEEQINSLIDFNYELAKLIYNTSDDEKIASSKKTFVENIEKIAKKNDSLKPNLYYIAARMERDLEIASNQLPATTTDEENNCIEQNNCLGMATSTDLISCIAKCLK